MWIGGWKWLIRARMKLSGKKAGPRTKTEYKEEDRWQIKGKLKGKRKVTIKDWRLGKEDEHDANE